MRIIGGHDYYDSAQAYGHDPKIVFVRGDDTLEEDAFKRPDSEVYFIPPERVKEEYHWRWKVHTISSKDGKWNFYTVRVIFCGILYNGIRAEHESWHAGKDVVEVFWDRNEFETWCSNTFPKLVPIFHDKRWRQIENEVLTSKRLTGDEYSTLLKNRVSIAIWAGLKKKWKINCTGLRELQFFRVFDAVTAFQELDMWMSGSLGMPGNPMVEVADDVRMAKHGMDKWSFRKKVR